MLVGFCQLDTNPAISGKREPCGGIVFVRSCCGTAGLVVLDYIRSQAEQASYGEQAESSSSRVSASVPASRFGAIRTSSDGL